MSVNKKAMNDYSIFTMSLKCKFNIQKRDQININKFLSVSQWGFSLYFLYTVELKRPFLYTVLLFLGLLGSFSRFWETDLSVSEDG